MNIGVGLVCGLGSLVLAATAHAAESAPPGGPDTASKPTRRSDFTLGASYGLGFGRAKGYPNEIQKIGVSEYRSNTKFALGSAGAAWLGVAFNDYLTFGLGMGGIGLSGNDRDASATTFLFHVDAYPLFDLHRALRDLGVFAQLGTGPMKIRGGEETADGGLLAYVEGGALYEGLRFWQLGIGPSLSVMHMWSESGTLTAGVLSARVAFYGGP